MKGLVPTAVVGEPSALETMLMESWKRELRAQAEIIAESTAQDMTVFCALCLLWGRSRDSSFQELLFPELTRLAQGLEEDIPDIMMCEVSTGVARPGRMDFLDGTVLALFWGELRAKSDLKEKLQAANFWPAPSLPHLFRRFRARSV
jgi:hypothetical protein